MTRTEAEEIIRAIRAGTRDYDRPKHFWDECEQEKFTVQDIGPILQSHTMRGAPQKTPYGFYRVRLIGKCLEGRRTLLVVDLRAEGTCALVSIMEDKAAPRTPRRKT